VKTQEEEQVEAALLSLFSLPRRLPVAAGVELFISS
jgi:hypothetical protein